MIERILCDDNKIRKIKRKRKKEKRQMKIVTVVLVGNAGFACK